MYTHPFFMEASASHHHGELARDAARWRAGQLSRGVQGGRSTRPRQIGQVTGVTTALGQAIPAGWSLMRIRVHALLARGAA